jgi:hypothetical protein
VVKWNRQQVTSEEDELRKEGKLEKGRQTEGRHAARSGHSTGHRGQYFAFLQNNLDLPAWCAYMSSTQCPSSRQAPTMPRKKEKKQNKIFGKTPSN